MTSNTEVDAVQVPAARTADQIGQATAVEQARAVAEVQGAIVVAQQCPRSKTFAVQEMRESCAQLGLAERAFFRYSRGSGQITGPSVHLARELARCWGNMQYGIAELRRDDTRGESEMLAFAWDVQTNTRATSTFIVKHGRDTKTGVKALTDLRDIYENNANNGARRLREQIFAILPKWFTEEAQDRCRATIEKGDSDKPLAQRIADMVRGFESMGIAVDQLERKVGREQGKWTAHDVAALAVIGRSISVGETTVDAEFPDDKVTADEIKQTKPRGRRPTTPPAENGPSAEDLAALNAEAAADAAPEPGSAEFQLDSA
jgi:hypothetical protein